MRMAIAQVGTRAGDFENTIQRMAECSQKAAADGVELLVFPSMVLCGSASVARPDREGFMIDMANALTDLIGTLACPCIVPVTFDVEGVLVYEALLIDGDGITPVRLMTLLDSARDAKESGSEPTWKLPEFEFAGVRLGVAFTYDELDEYVQLDYNIDVLLFLSAYGFALDDPSSAMGSALSEARFVDDAEDMGAWIVGVGSVGCYDTQVFCGSSFVLSPWGEILAQAPVLEEALLSFDIDPHFEGPLDSPLVAEVFDPTMLTWEVLAAGIRELVSSLGATEACVLVDGTATSALAATLSVDALGPTRVHTLVVDQGNTEALSCAQELVRALRIPDENIEPVNVSSAPDPDLAHDLAETYLAAVARRPGVVSIGSADKTTLALDGTCRASAAQIQPLADLYMTDVFALAHLRNTISPVIPAATLRIFHDDLTRSLVPDMDSAEQRLAFVDLVLCSYLEWGRSVSDIVSTRGRPEAVEAILARLHDVEPVRQDGGIIIAVSSRTLAEAHGPLGLSWRDHVRSSSERMSEEAVENTVREVLGEASPEEVSTEEREREERIRDLLGYLRDFSQGGAFSDQDTSSSGGRYPSQNGPYPSSWEGPFSEN